MNEHATNAAALTRTFVRKRVTELGTFSTAQLRLTIDEVQPMMDELGALCVRLQTEVLCQSVSQQQETVIFKAPATWWQHLKQDLFPRWLLNRFPVRQAVTKRVVRYEILASYPQADIAVPDIFGKPVMIGVAAPTE